MSARKDIWRGGRKDMRTLCPFDEDVPLYAHFLYEPDPPGHDPKNPKTWGRRWMVLGPADESEWDPQRVVDSLADAINAERGDPAAVRRLVAAAREARRRALAGIPVETVELTAALAEFPEEE